MIKARLIFAVLMLAASLSAAPVVLSYDVINGDLGTWSYLDSTYTPCPAAVCTTSGATLTGGTGLLTDGFAAPYSWNGSGLPGGSFVPWVGWYAGAPTLTVHFQGTPTISNVALYLDNTPGYGDVRLPEAVIIAGTSYAVAPDGVWGPRWVYFNITPVTAASLDITLYGTAGIWNMLGEVGFEVPEPATVSLCFAGLAALALARGRKRG
jgi:hypothetical protein